MPLILIALLAACSTSAPVASQPFYLIKGTAPGDPCTAERTLIDTPRGYPRLCINKKWVPLCDTLPSAEKPDCTKQ